MAAPRASQFIALRNLARGSHQVRSLHMTGPATYGSPVLTQGRPVLNLPRDIAGLRVECKRRKIEFSGSKQDLLARLNADELAHSRAFSTAIEQAKRPTVASPEQAIVRHFNTSRSLKQVNDSSTIDFAFLPDVDPDNAEAAEFMRVPIIPTNFNPVRTGAHAPETENVVVMKPQISSMSADAVFLPMSDLHDGHAMNVDFHALADSVASNIRRMGAPVEEQAGLIKQIWNDMVDDILGPKQKPART